VLRYSLFFLLFLLVAVAPAHAAETFDFVIIQPGQPGTSEDAQPVMDSLAAYIQEKLGGEVAVHGRYFNRVKDADAYLADNHPRWGIVQLGYFLGRGEASCMTPLAATRPGGSESDMWRMLVVKGGPDEWQSAKGTVYGTMLFQPDVAARLLFGKAAGDLPFSLEGTFRPLRALRSVLRGKATGVILDQPQYDAVLSLPQSDDLKVLQASDPLPTSAVVAFGPPAEIHDRLRGILQDMQNDPAAGDLLQLLQTEGFGPADSRLETMRENGA
jgi:hypothetical protein